MADVAVLTAIGAAAAVVGTDQHGLWPCPTFTSLSSLTASIVGALSAALCAAPDLTDLALCAAARSANDKLAFRPRRSELEI